MLDVGQLAPLDLATRSSRHLVDDGDLPRDLVAGQTLSHVRLQLPLADARAGLQHDERGQPLPETSRLKSKLVTDAGPIPDWDYVYKVVDAIEEVAKETAKSIPQIALNWLLQRPTVSTVVIGARNEKQLTDNLGAIGWSLTPEQVKLLDKASATTPAYPYWHQKQFKERNPFPTRV